MHLLRPRFLFPPITAQTGRAAGSFKAQEALSQTQRVCVRKWLNMQAHASNTKNRKTCAACMHALYTRRRGGQRRTIYARPINTPRGRSRAASARPIIHAALATGNSRTQEPAPTARAPPPAGWGHTRRSRPASRTDDNAVARDTKGTFKLKIGRRAGREGRAAATGSHFSSLI